jgi:glycerol-3-phosphate acyltransferase PlsY
VDTGCAAPRGCHNRAVSFALGCVLAYLLGGIPFALVLVWAIKRVDVRTLGSGNVGATNASTRHPVPHR